VRFSDALGDEKSLRMFRTIYDGLPFTIGGMNLTRKQYYSRLYTIINAGLVDKSNGRYKATSFGKVVHGFLDLLGSTLAKDYWKFTAIDSLTNANSSLPADERIEIISSLRQYRYEGNTIRTLIKHALESENCPPQNIIAVFRIKD
jgi:hypothetical protein